VVEGAQEIIPVKWADSGLTGNSELIGGCLITQERLLLDTPARGGGDFQGGDISLRGLIKTSSSTKEEGNFVNQ